MRLLELPGAFSLQLQRAKPKANGIGPHISGRA
jgi:hypothetical protein